MTKSRTATWAALAGAGAALALAAAAAHAAAPSPTDQRQALMKQVGQAMKEGAALTSATTPFDAAKVKTIMATVADSAKKLHSLYPADSATDPKTSADPSIWTNKADFDKRLNDLSTLAVAAGKTTSTDTYKPAFFAVGQTCNACHMVYRKKKTT